MSGDQVQGIVRLVVGVALCVGLVDALLLCAWFLHDVVGKPTRPWFASTWSLLHVWFAIQGAVLMVGVASLAVGLALGGRVSAGPMVGLVFFQNVVFVAVSSSLIFGAYGADMPAVGVTWLPRRRDLLVGLGLGVLLCALGALVQAGSAWLLHATVSSGRLKWLEEATRALSASRFFPRDQVLASPGLFAAVLVAIGIATPIGEEFLFRALLHRTARLRLGAFWGTAVSSAAFALVHAGPLQVLAILPMGVALGVAYDRTRSLWAPILMHAVNNTLGVLALYFLPGMN